MNIVEIVIFIVFFVAYRLVCGRITYKAGLKKGITKYFWVGLILGSIGVFSVIYMNGFTAVRNFRNPSRGWDEEIQWMCPKCESINFKREETCPCGFTLKEYKKYLEDERRAKYYAELNEKKANEEEDE